MKMNVECPECGRQAVVHDGQGLFVCSDGIGCACLENMDELTGTLICRDGKWCLEDVRVAK